MIAPLLDQILIALGMGILGAVIFAGIGLISGSDETTTLAPLTLLVVLLGVPAPGVLRMSIRPRNFSIFRFTTSMPTPRPEIEETCAAVLRPGSKTSL